MEMMITRINPADSPKVIGPYSQCVASGNLVFSAGQIGIDPKTGKLVDGGFANQVRQTLENLRTILSAAGSGPEKVLKATIYFTDLSNYKEFNEIYAAFFSGNFPARAAVQVSALPAGALVEIDIIATR
ncbi:MAG: Rid family detoxifying hydrolase [archaeon]